MAELQLMAEGIPTCQVPQQFSISPVLHLKLQSIIDVSRQCNKKSLNCDTLDFLCNFGHTHAQYLTWSSILGSVNVKGIVQTRLFKKHNVDSYYCCAMYKFIKEGAIANSKSEASFSYCKIQVSCKGAVISGSNCCTK